MECSVYLNIRRQISSFYLTFSLLVAVVQGDKRLHEPRTWNESKTRKEFVPRRTKKLTPRVEFLIHFQLHQRLQKLNRENKVTEVLTVKGIFVFLLCHPLMRHQSSVTISYYNFYVFKILY